VNSVTTAAETIRFEIAGEKAQGRPGHHPEKRGYGYPGWKMDNVGVPTGTGAIVTITDNASATFARRYFGITVSTGWASAVYTLTFDNVGRFISFSAALPAAIPGATNGQNLLETLTNAMLPHPADFGPNGPLNPTNDNGGGTFGWTTGISVTIVIDGVTILPTGDPGDPSKIWIPTSAVAAELSQLNYATAGPSIQGVFTYDALQSSVIRLNNFVLGDGYEFIRSSGNSVDTDNTDGTTFTDTTLSTTLDIFAQRTASPKLLLTFGGIDYDSMINAGLSDLVQSNLIAAGLAPLMKVTTIIESAQNDSSVRTYTIPKADNTGGSFMVITDHMGQREKDAPGLATIPQNFNKTRIYLDKVVAHEVVRTGDVRATQAVAVGFNVYDPAGPVLNYTGYEMLPIHYVKNYGGSNNLRCEQVLVDPAEPLGRKLGANIRRDLSTYWAVDNTSWTSELQTREGTTDETFEKSEIRYRRLNENYVMFDFNIDLEALIYNNVVVDTTSPYSQETLANLDYILGDDLFEGASLNGYSHSPYSPGHLVTEFTFGATDISYNFWAGIDARWVQYIRFIYDAQLDTIDDISDDSFFWENQYGGGPTFGNWNEYRAWNAGTATVGPKITSALQAALLSPNYRDGQGVSVHSYNASDGSQNYQFDNSSPFTGYGWSQPTDGSPYSSWSLATDLNLSTPTSGVTRYWNGRLNDWFYSRWSQTNTVSGIGGIVVAGPDYYPSQSNTNLGAASNKYKDAYPAEFPYPGVDYWENNETTGSANFGYPTTVSQPNQSYINQYAYKTLWKWVLPLGVIGNSGLPPSYVYIEHTKMFDNIVNRTFGDDAWSRNGNMQWKVTPIADGNGKYSASAVGLTLTSTESGTNTSFAIEVMFDKPIFVSGRTLSIPELSTDLSDGSVDSVIDAVNRAEYYNHISTQLNFAGINIDETSTKLSFDQEVKLYSNLTLRGQSVVKYKQTKRNKSTTTPFAP
jgi:hypothetical protein